MQVSLSHKDGVAETSLSPDEIVRQSFDLAKAAHDQGRLEEAEALYRAILSCRPDHFDALHGMGVLAFSAGRPEVAEAFIDAAVKWRPHPTFFNNLGLVRLALKRPHDALASIYRALELRSTYPEAYEALGNVQIALGQRGEAVASYERAIEMKPRRATAHANLAKALVDVGDIERAEAACRAAIEIDPNLAEAHNTMGNILRIRRDIDGARDHFTRALKLRPAFAEAYNNLAVLLLGEGECEEAMKNVRCALVCDEGMAAAWATAGAVLLKQDRYAEAVDYLEKSLKLDAGYIPAYNNLGCALLKLDSIERAVEAFEKAIELSEEGLRAAGYYHLGTELLHRERPEAGLEKLEKALLAKGDFGAAQVNKGFALQRLGLTEEACQAYGRAIELAPELAAGYNNKLMAMQYMDGYSNDDCLAAARDFGRAFVRENDSRFPGRDRSPERRLRIGYVSGDFSAHPVGFFTHGALTRHDHERFEIYCYSNCQKHDEITAAFKGAADHWRDISKLSDAEVVETIKADEIDILFDLAGHTDKTRVQVFGARMAPVQVHWVGFTGTIGLPTIDYIILDPVSAPEGSDRFYQEAIVRLPHGRFCFTPLAPDEPLQEPPCLRNGFVTFGCFNNITKVGPKVIALWARIMKQAPNSRLILKSKTLVHASVRDPILAAFAAEGVSADRIDMRGASAYLDMLREYNEIDIALDPFPFGGATTTSECLFMGLPVITLPGDRLASRQTLAFLHPMGHEEFVADSMDDYVAKAVALARDPERLRRLRPEIRRALLDAPFSDGPRFVRDLEQALRVMWRRFVEGEPPAPFEIRA